MNSRFNFFEQQVKSRQRSRWFIIGFSICAFLVAAILGFLVSFWVYVFFVNGGYIGSLYSGGHFFQIFLIILKSTSFWVSVLVVMASILIVALKETSNLRQGGGLYVGTILDGQYVEIETQEPKERYLLNIVDEMSIAAGVPRPHLFILTGEQSINAMTSGTTCENQAIIFTKGAVEKLNREELQAVAAHEFAHIVSGDCALNIKMAGYLSGLVALMAVARVMIFGFVGLERRRGGGPAVILLGILIYVPGYIGNFFASLLQAIFSRHREYLADALAAQFTRDPLALASALKKIAVSGNQKLKVSRMALSMRSFFISAPLGLKELFSTHPLLEERIAALDPTWNGTLPIEHAKPFPEAATQKPLSKKGRPSQFSEIFSDWRGGMLLPVMAALNRNEPANFNHPSAGADSAALLGNSLELAKKIYAEWPEPIKAALRNQAASEKLLAAIFCVHQAPQQLKDRVEAKQVALIRKFMSEEAVNEVLGLAKFIKTEHRLPLLDLVGFNMKFENQEKRLTLGRLISGLIASDGELDLFEVAAGQILRCQLPIPLFQFKPVPGDQRDDKTKVRSAVVELLSALAGFGAVDSYDVRQAFMAGMNQMKSWPRYELVATKSITAQSLALSLHTVVNAPIKIKNLLLQAAITTILYDRQVTQKEYEILRALMAALNVPLPLAQFKKTV